ncbi:hypothetical protein PHYBLDRAFT_149658 [Phycomyces blakesleeanus NRRL 1555(-)]|uniref:Uncharacterized protein n=1 Tax=Phycomyces blakesleeanus (strain ATCC 8743b / DSM 1359 / FGSC 10004 / NBRC 33097 / NRRL 1555) TaxID=763407 RepID=A0A167KZR9_PHYB8|nr:hypothetical protein PHYBLDRAFT_149658 [Phycomyces blakesleeanus NRRL 1555(-)]OAD69256.1 hypothetical protein PHYBLDRAFT_149658 [Phycomyces blakesleeanus NRRL 1555(-)]|eukprot:XP_018287296.1 hypothetical protein PHYBLDRAFT_149658 [Phycomyces blakesleeanus NRRL 1555(-)]
MDYISYIPPSDYYIIDNESEEQIEDVAYQHGDIKKIINFDTITENLKTISIDDDKRKYKKYIPEKLAEGSTFVGWVVRAIQGILLDHFYVWIILLQSINNSFKSVACVVANIQ